MGWLLSYLFVHEPFQWVHLISIALLTLAVIVTSFHKHRHTHVVMEHIHYHQHTDGHHTHSHEGETIPSRKWHSHLHSHNPVTHEHPHDPICTIDTSINIKEKQKPCVCRALFNVLKITKPVKSGSVIFVVILFQVPLSNW